MSYLSRAPSVAVDGEVHVVDRESQLEEPPEDLGQRRRDVLVDDELARVRAPIEPPVRDSEEAQPGLRNRTSSMPEVARLHLRPNARRQRPDRRVERRAC